ncbi:hypothetical protein ACWDR3_11675 [Streptomyces sp. NPDC001002]
MTSVHQLTALLGLLGACACVMDRLAGPFRALMVCGASGAALATGACAVAAVALWTAVTGPSGGRGTAVVDLATMAVLTACASRIGRDGAPGHRSAMHMPGAPGTYDIRLFLLLVGCWALARVGVRLTTLVTTSGPPPTDGVGARRGAALQEGGSVAMVVAMAAMLA